jgi:hypothetical protein
MILLEGRSPERPEFFDTGLPFFDSGSDAGFGMPVAGVA